MNQSIFGTNGFWGPNYIPKISKTYEDRLDTMRERVESLKVSNVVIMAKITGDFIHRDTLPSTILKRTLHCALGEESTSTFWRLHMGWLF